MIFFLWFFTVSNNITRLHFYSRFSGRSTIGTRGWMTWSLCLMILRRFMLLIPKQNQFPKLKFWWGYSFVNISFKIAMILFLMLLVDVEWPSASLPGVLIFFFFSFLFVLATFCFWWITLLKQFSCRTMFPKRKMVML